MDPRALHLITALQMRPHPEGGYFSEVYRAAAVVSHPEACTARAALTTIYFLLPAGEVSRCHRVTSDEVWHHYEGDPLELLTADPEFQRVASAWLGPVDDRCRPVHVVRAGDWQAARSAGRFTLVGCTVAPGFQFDDFALLSDQPERAARMAQQHPRYAGFI